MYEAMVASFAVGVYATALVLWVMKRRPNGSQEILELRHRVEKNELHWDSTYAKIRNALRTIRMREGREKRRIPTSTSRPIESRDPSQSAPDDPSGEDPPDSREDLWESMYDR